MRKVGAAGGAQGRATVQNRNGSKVVKLGETRTAARAREAEQISTSSSRARRRTRSSWCWRSSATSATRTTRTRTPTRAPRADDVQRAAAQRRSRRRIARKDNSTIWQPDFNRQHYQDLYFGTGEDSVQVLLREAVVGPLQRRRHGHGLGQGPLQRGPLRALERLPVRGQRLREHVEPDPGRDQRVGRSAARRGPHRRADQGRPRVLSTSGTATTTTTTATSTSRTATSTTSRSSTPAATRPTATLPGRGRDLVAPLEGVPEPGRHRGPEFNKDGGTQIGTTGLWVADYTIQPENGGVSVFAHEYAHDLGLPDEYDTGGDRPRTTPSTGGR